MRSLPRLLALALLAACAGDRADVAGDAPTASYAEEDAALGPGMSVRIAGEPPQPTPGADAALATPPTAPTLDPMLIRTGSATIRVDSLERGIAAVRALARRHGGIVGTQSITGGEHRFRDAMLEVRIPSERFDAALAGLAPIGRVESVSVSAQDVTEQYADVDARVANARRLEERLLALLERRTGSLQELLQIERELARVREEIERYEGRLRYLRTRASVSVLTVTLREPEALIGSRPGERPIRDAFRQAWENFVGLLAWLIAAAGVLVPVGVLGFLLWRGWRAVRRRDAVRDAARGQGEG